MMRTAPRSSFHASTINTFVSRANRKKALSNPILSVATHSPSSTLNTRNTQPQYSTATYRPYREKNILLDFFRYGDRLPTDHSNAPVSASDMFTI